MSSVLRAIATVSGGSQTNGGSNASFTGAGAVTDVWVTCDILIDSSQHAELITDQSYSDLISLSTSGNAAADGLAVTSVDNSTVQWWTDKASNGPWGTIAANTWYTVEWRNHLTGGVYTQELYINTASVGAITLSGSSWADIQHYIVHNNYFGGGFTDGSYSAYFRNMTVGSTRGASDIFSMGTLTSTIAPPFTGSSGGTDIVITNDPAVATPGGRVLIAWDDGPLVPSPTWTAIDQGGSTFPHDFVSGYDIHTGRKTLISQTDTGTATVYVNDRSGLLDDRNVSSPYQGKLSGRQIMLQLYNPVTTTWEPQFRGLIDDYTYDIDGSAVDANGDPINASIQIDCVDMFDYLNGYGLTPGLDGVTPPVGGEDSVYYAATSGTVDDRIIEILTDAGIDSTMYIVASGNIKVVEAKYDPDESALTALRDAADAELPFIANIYVNRSGLFCFRGRYSRFAPDGVAAEPESQWDFTRWSVGDGQAIQSDPTRAQMRILSYSRDRAELINAAICYPQGLAAADMPGQVYANTASITAYGKHAANPLSDLLTGDYAGPGTISPSDGKTQCVLYAQLLVENKKDPRLSPTALQLKSINTTDFRASATWDVLTRSDISHIVNIAAGYPGGTGLAGGATVDDYYIEGRALTVRPANTSYDYVELDLEVSPFVWSADTHGVFPAFGS